MTPEILKMLNPRSQSTCVFPTFSRSGGMLWRSVGVPSRNDRPPDIWDRMVDRETFLQIQRRFSSARYPQGFNPWISNVRTYVTACTELTSNIRHSFGSEMPVRTVSQEFSRRFFKELWNRRTTIADFGSSF